MPPLYGRSVESIDWDRTNLAQNLLWICTYSGEEQVIVLTVIVLGKKSVQRWSGGIGGKGIVVSYIYDHGFARAARLLL
jgi:hypothetical protein